MASVESSLDAICTDCGRVNGIKQVEGGVTKETFTAASGIKIIVPAHAKMTVCGWCGARQPKKV